MKTSYLKYHRDSDYLENENMFKNIFRKRFQIANKFIDRPGKVLDIGASTGVMLDIFKENGWQTFGVEPSESSLVATKKGHNISNVFFEKVNFKKNYFDLIILNHTLEHLEDPEKVLVKAFNLLKRGGAVLVDVPNAGGIGSKLLGKKWPYLLPKEHISQFTKDSLSDVFAKAGFKIIHFESRSGIFEYSNPVLALWQSLTSFKKRFFEDILLSPYSLLVTLLNMGDSMTIVGKKVL